MTQVARPPQPSFPSPGAMYEQLNEAQFRREVERVMQSLVGSMAATSETYSDHGALTGLGDDDHSQYHTDARALTWLGTQSIASFGTKDHHLLTGLADDDHSQYHTDARAATWHDARSVGTHSDVTLSGLAVDELLKWNGSAFVNANVLLNEIANPDGDKTFNMTTRTLKFLWTNPAGNPMELEASGAYSGAVLHIHQHTGNPGATRLFEIEATDTDVVHMLSVGALATSSVLCTRVTGDTFDRSILHSDGKWEWGSGSGALDTNLYRGGADLLKTDDSFQMAKAGGYIYIEDVTLLKGGAGVLQTNDNFTIGGGTLNIGADCNLYRSAANVLKTDDSLTVVGTLTAATLSGGGGGTITGLTAADIAGGTFGAGDFHPAGDSNEDLGASGSVWAEVWADSIKSDGNITIDSGGVIYLKDTIYLYNTSPTFYFYDTDGAANQKNTAFYTNNNVMYLMAYSDDWLSNDKWLAFYRSGITLSYIDVGGDVYPDTDSSFDLGKTGKVWAEVWTDALKSDGAITCTPTLNLNGGHLNVQAGYIHIDRAGDAATAVMYISADDGQVALFDLRTGSSTRWRFGRDNDAEGGGNEGSNFYINRYSDAAAFIDQPFLITREDGHIWIGNDLYPDADSSNDLGKTGAVWAEVWADYLKADADIQIDAGSGAVYFKVGGANKAYVDASTMVLMGLNMTLDNNKWIYMDDAASSARPVMGVDAGDDLLIGHTTELDDVYIRCSSGHSIYFNVAGTSRFAFDADNLRPIADSSYGLGETGKVFSEVWTDKLTSDNIIYLGGTHIYCEVPFWIHQTAPTMYMCDTDGAADQKITRFYSNSNVFYLSGINDAWTNTDHWITIYRSGENMTYMELGGDLHLMGEDLLIYESSTARFKLTYNTTSNRAEFHVMNASALEDMLWLVGEASGPYVAFPDGHRPSFMQTTGAPFTVASSTVVTNLNADTVDGVHGTDIVSVGSGDTDTYIAVFSATSEITGNANFTWDDATGLLAIGTVSGNAGIKVSATTGGIVPIEIVEAASSNQYIDWSTVSAQIGWKADDGLHIWNENATYDKITIQNDTGSLILDEGAWTATTSFGVTGTFSVSSTSQFNGAMDINATMTVQNIYADGASRNIGQAGTPFDIIYANYVQVLTGPLYTNHIAEYTASHNIEFDDPIDVDTIVSSATITLLPAGNNVVIGDTATDHILTIYGTSTGQPRLHISGGSGPSSGGPRISFAGRPLAGIYGDDAADWVYGFYSTFSNTRTNDAILRVFGSAASSWGTYIQLSHDGSDGYIGTDVGDILIDAAGGNVKFADVLTFTGGRAIYNDVGTSSLYVSGGSSQSSGANFLLYGQTASPAFDMQFRASSTVKLTYDHSESQWYWTAAQQVYNQIKDNGTLAANTAFNWNNGNVQFYNVTGGGSYTHTFSNLEAGSMLTLVLRNGSGGALGSWTWPTEIKWEDSTAPTLPANGDVIVVSFLCIAATRVLGRISGQWDTVADI